MEPTRPRSESSTLKTLFDKNFYTTAKMKDFVHQFANANWPKGTWFARPSRSPGNLCTVTYIADDTKSGIGRLKNVRLEFSEDGKIIIRSQHQTRPYHGKRCESVKEVIQTVSPAVSATQRLCDLLDASAEG